MAYDGNWINELDDTLPLGTEAKSFGDDGIREIKRALTNSFPGTVAGDAYTGLLSELQALVDTAVPRNTVIMWSGVEADAPNGWVICDGRARPSGGNAPDLRNKFVLGAKSDTDVTPDLPVVGTEWGTAETVIRGSLGLGPLIEFETDAHALVPGEIPDLSDNLQLGFDASSQSDSHNYVNTVARGRDTTVNSWASNPVRSNGLNGTGHRHTFTIDTTGQATGSNMPPYYALLFLIKE